MNEIRAYFEFKGTGEKDLIVMKLVDPSTIRQARSILNGDEISQIHPQGAIILEKARYNPRWGFHNDPASISFFRDAIELCDANMRYIEVHLDEVGGSLLPIPTGVPGTQRSSGRSRAMKFRMDSPMPPRETLSRW